MLCVFSNQVKWLVKRHEIIASHDRSPKIIGFLQKRGVVYRRRMCYTQSMEQLWTLLLLGRVWGRHAPTRSLRKCRRTAEVKSQWSTTFSRIENLWPRDGSCPLPLRSKRFISKCFRIVKTQKISRGTPLMYGSHRLLRTKFLPLFVQRRCPARSRKVWGHGTVSRSDGLFKIQGAVWRKLGAVRTLRPASFKHKNNTLRLCCQQLKTDFRELHNYKRFYL